MAYLRCTGAGGGATPIITFSPQLVFEESGIGVSNWMDTSNTTPLSVNSGTYTATAGEKVTVNSTNNLLMSMTVPDSYHAFGIRCKIPSTFSPRNSNNWYDCSCILGQELGGQQRDCAIIIDKNGYFALGTGLSAVDSTTVYALDDQEHTLLMIVESSSIKLYIDGVLEKEVAISMSGNQMGSIGVFWNRSSNATIVYGEIYAVGYWSEVVPSMSYSLPTF